MEQQSVETQTQTQMQTKVRRWRLEGWDWMLDEAKNESEIKKRKKKDEKKSRIVRIYYIQAKEKKDC